MTNIRCYKNTNDSTGESHYEVTITKYKRDEFGRSHLVDEMDATHLTRPEFYALYEAIGEVININEDNVKSIKEIPDDIDESLKEVH